MMGKIGKCEQKAEITKWLNGQWKNAKSVQSSAFSNSDEQNIKRIKTKMQKPTFDNQL